VATLARTRRRRAPILRRRFGAAATDSRNVLREFVRTRHWWQTVLLVIGFVTVVTTFSVLILGLDDKPDKVSLTGEIGTIGSIDFLSTVSRSVGAPVEHGGGVVVLQNGDEFVPALLDAIHHAQRSINFSVFMWSDGTFSDQVLAALLERQQHGVAVRVLLDAVGTIAMPDRAFAPLQAAGAMVEKFRKPTIGNWTRVHRRNHRRAIVIDGRVGFTGGMAVSDKWLGHAEQPDHWRDVMFKVTGPMAASLQAAFADVWATAAAEILTGPDMYPDRAAETSDDAQPSFIHLINSPADDDQSMAYFYLLPVLAARERIWIATPYFIPDDPLRTALMEQARRGVDVRLLLPGPHIDNRMNRWSAQTHYDELIRAGVRIFEYQPTFLHSKFAVFDGRWSVFGSPNVNARSRHLDEENAYGVLDPSLGHELEEMFAADLKRSEEIRLEGWRKRSDLVRFLQWMSKLLDEQS
jgi:cardiolipin synthase